MFSSIIYVGMMKDVNVGLRKKCPCVCSSCKLKIIFAEVVNKQPWHVEQRDATEELESMHLDELNDPHQTTMRRKSRMKKKDANV
jgi:hypothetical protein